jgi:hypothetical protein
MIKIRAISSQHLSQAGRSLRTDLVEHLKLFQQFSPRQRPVSFSVEHAMEMLTATERRVTPLFASGGQR